MINLNVRTHGIFHILFFNLHRLLLLSMLLLSRLSMHNLFSEIFREFAFFNLQFLQIMNLVFTCVNRTRISRMYRQGQGHPKNIFETFILISHQPTFSLVFTLCRLVHLNLRISHGILEEIPSCIFHSIDMVFQFPAHRSSFSKKKPEVHLCT